MPNETPPPRPETYAGVVDLDLRQYIRSAIYHALAAECQEIAAHIKNLEHQLETVRDDNRTLTGLIVEARYEVQKLKEQTNVDEKYILTRQKIIDFMKAAGIK